MPPAPPSLRALALADVTPEDVRWMIQEGEALAELKAEIPEEGLGPTISSFANTLGGWLLLGVDDKTRDTVGWEPKGRADVLDYLRDLLVRDVDPLPPFAAKSLTDRGRPVAVVRIYESADTPHIVRGTGAVYVRRPGGKQPIDDHRLLLDLARRGDEALARAKSRLSTTPSVAYVLRTPDSGYRDEATADVRVVARATPMTVTSMIRDWALTRDAGDWCLERCSTLLPPTGLPYGRRGPHPEAFGRGIAARLVQEKGPDATDQASVIVDAAGVVGAELRRGPLRGERASILLQGMLEDELLPLAAFLSDTLRRTDATGRAMADLWVLIPPKGQVHGARKPLPSHLHVARELVAPADDSAVRSLASYEAFTRNDRHLPGSSWALRLNRPLWQMQRWTGVWTPSTSREGSSDRSRCC